MAAQEVVELATHLSELEAASMLAALKDAGIAGVVAGGTLANIWPEVPKWVTIAVRREDFERAREIVEAIRREAAQVDWDNVDVGEMEDGENPRS